MTDVVKQLSDSFKDDPSLRAMGDLYDKIKRKAPYLVQPNVPEKHNMSTQADNSDDEELQKALKMSLFEYEKQKKLQEQEKRKCRSPSAATAAASAAESSSCSQNTGTNRCEKSSGSI